MLKIRRLLIRLLSAVLLCSLLLAAVPADVAVAACDDSVVTPGNDTVLCDVDPPVGEEVLGLDLGDDSYTQNAGVTTDVVAGDLLPDGSFNIGDGGNDTIIIHGDVLDFLAGDGTDGDGGDDTITITSTGSADFVYGDAVDEDGGNDTIVIGGDVFVVLGDDAGGNGGNDYIFIDSTGSAFGVAGDDVDDDGGGDVIIINGVALVVIGDSAGGDGGDDIIVINGIVEDVIGDDVGGTGGNDTIYVYGTVIFDVCGDCAAVDGDDTVVLGANAEVGGDIDGQGGFDTLVFEALRQSELDALGLDPAGDTLTINGHTYDWFNFESLIGLLAELAERGLRVFFASDSLLAVESDDHLGISVFAEHGRIAFISFANADGLGVGETATYATPNAAGWYVIVTNLGASADHPGHSLYQVNIYNAAGGSAGQFTFVN